MSFSLEGIVKDIRLKISKRKISKFCVSSFDDVFNDWLAEKMVKTIKLVIILITLMNCLVKKKKLILTQVRSAH